MTRHLRHPPTKPSRRAIKNEIAAAKCMYAPEIYGAVVEVEHPKASVTASASGPRTTPKRQAESAVNKAVQQAARLIRGELRRNRQGMVDMPGGWKMPFGLGTGTLDLVGPVPVLITPAMVGRTISAYCEVESKTDTGRLEEHQQQRIEHLRDMGAISGVCRNGEDFLSVVERWKTEGFKA